MEITKVKIIPVKQGNMLASADITIDNCFVVHDFQVVQGPKGLFLSMPTRKLMDGTFENICFPVNDETRRMLEERVIGAYRKLVGAGAMRGAIGAR
jgi:stage V sporulation protein G